MNTEEIKKELAQQESLLCNYQDLEVDIEDDAAYVARGNGFCDTKYSQDFLEGRIRDIEKRIAELKGMLAAAD